VLLYRLWNNEHFVLICLKILIKEFIWCFQVIWQFKYY
jgi:hypothetical protein